MDHPKVRIFFGDGFEFVRKCAKRARSMETGNTIDEWWDPFIPRDGKFDVIITDNYQLEPDHVIDHFYSEDYFKNIHQALRQPQGVMSSLGTLNFYFKVHFYTVQ